MLAVWEYDLQETKLVIPARSGGSWVLKNVVDFVFALILLVLTAPIIGVAALLVMLTSCGPAIYSQVRLGRGGRPYTIYKLRTMYSDCERGSGPQWARARDPRITWLGRILRRTHLDELPQLWNVLRGEMSLVGPRPERPEFVPQLARAIPRYPERLGVRPGLTGLAQVQLPADTDLNSVRRKLRYDLYYIQHASLWLDLRLMLATGFNVIGCPDPISSWLVRIPGPRAVERPPIQSAHSPLAGRPEVVNVEPQAEAV
jgi:lipopolysaccharide/colanic/teichoic acid biosynthesis glycosyltransferase